MASLKAKAAVLWQSPSLWLLGSNLLTRGLSFIVTLLIARTVGVAALGMYSSTLISAASLTTPISQAMANSATLMAAREAGGVASWRKVLAANAWVLGVCALLAVAGPWFLYARTDTQDSFGVMPAVGYTVVAALALGQLLSQFMLGLAHGTHLSRQSAWVVTAVMLIGLLSCWPVIQIWGLTGALVQAALVMAAPGLLLWLHARCQSAAISAAEARAGYQDAWARFSHALPSIGSTFINNGTNWLCCIYWVLQHHGHTGVGLVAIGLQWAVIMQLPVNSWGGRIVHALGAAAEQGPSALKKETAFQVRRCVGVTVLMGLGISALSPWIADLYQADRHMLIALILINGLATVVSSVNYVFERVFFCLDSQRVWLATSMFTYAIQLVFTAFAIPHSLLAVAWGNLLAVSLIMVIVFLHLRWRWRQTATVGPAHS